MEWIDVLVEPIFRWKRLSFLTYKWPITHIPNKLAFKITIRMPKDVPRFKEYIKSNGKSDLPNYKIPNEIDLYKTPSIPSYIEIKLLEWTLKEENFHATYHIKSTVKKLRFGKSKTTKNIKIIFPYPKAYFPSVLVRSDKKYFITTTQKTLEGLEGRGHHEPGGVYNECLVPIIVKDHLATRLHNLTYWILVLTAILVISTVLEHKAEIIKILEFFINLINKFF